MIDSTPLKLLLERKFLSYSLQKLAVNDPTLLERLSLARQALNPPRGRHDQPRITHGVLAFRIQGRNTPYPDLKYACYGIALATDWSGRRLLDDDRLVDELLHTIASLRLLQPNRFTACCRALQYAWHNNIATDNLSSSSPGILKPGGKSHKIANFLLRHTQPDRRRARQLAG